jgi:predicted DNA-binding mobile mystery protein A
MNSKYKKIAQEQNSNLINQVAGQWSASPPRDGWIKTVRSALAMSGTALSKRLGGHRTTAAYLERSEQDGSITLKKMQQVAGAMQCRFVYALVPDSNDNNSATIESIIEAQAERKARSIIKLADTQMARERQQLSAAQTEREVQRLKQQLLMELPRDFWEG